MKISETTSGCIAPVSQAFTTTQTRDASIYGKPKKGSNLLKGIKSSAKFANSLHEGQGVAEGSNDYFKRRKDEEDRIAGTKPPAKRTPQQTDYAKRRAQEKKVEQGVAEGAPELLKKEMPLHRHAEKLLAQNGVSKDDPDYHHHLGNTIKHLRQFGNIDLIKNQGVAEGSLNEFAPGGNFKPPAVPKGKGNDPWGDDDRSQIAQAVKGLLASGNKVDWQVPGQMGHVVSVDDRYITLRKWNQPRSKMRFALRITADRDSKYQIVPKGEKHYRVISSGLDEGKQDVAENSERDVYKKAYMDGYNGKSFNSPYKPGSDEDDEYDEGWHDGRLDYEKQDVAEGKPQQKADRYHINKDGKPATLASYADKDSAVKDRDAKYPDAKVHQVGPRGKVKGEFEEGVAEGNDSEELANEVYSEFERIYPNLARRADERTIHAAIIDVLNYGGDSNPSALAQDVARAVKQDLQGVAEKLEEKAVSRKQQKFFGMAHSMQKGKNIKGASPELKKVAKSMGKQDVEDFAKTKHKGLPTQVDEADLSENDLILVPGQGTRLKPGFISKENDRTDREVEMALSDLLQANQNSKKIFKMVKTVSEEQGLEGWVQEKIIKASDYLNTVREYLESKSVTSQVDEYIEKKAPYPSTEEVNLYRADIKKLSDQMSVLNQMYTSTTDLTIQRQIKTTLAMIAKKRAELMGHLEQRQTFEEEVKTVAKTWDQMTPTEKVSGVKGRTVWNPLTQKYRTVFDVPVTAQPQ